MGLPNIPFAAIAQYRSMKAAGGTSGIAGMSSSSTSPAASTMSQEQQHMLALSNPSLAVSFNLKRMKDRKMTEHQLRKDAYARSIYRYDRDSGRKPDAATQRRVLLG